jgi:hypothetical protein
VNFYNINAQVIKVNTIIKQNLVRAVCTGACLCLRKEEVSLELHELLTPRLVHNLLLDVEDNLSQNAMLNFKD